jgi:hypothetical protein
MRGRKGGSESLLGIIWHEMIKGDGDVDGYRGNVTNPSHTSSASKEGERVRGDPERDLAMEADVGQVKSMIPS